MYFLDVQLYEYFLPLVQFGFFNLNSGCKLINLNKCIIPSSLCKDDNLNFLNVKTVLTVRDITL